MLIHLTISLRINVKLLIMAAPYPKFHIKLLHQLIDNILRIIKKMSMLQLCAYELDVLSSKNVVKRIVSWLVEVRKCTTYP